MRAQIAVRTVLGLSGQAKYPAFYGVFPLIRSGTCKSYQLSLDSHSHQPGVNAYHVPMRFQAAKLQGGEATIYLDMV